MTATADTILMGILIVCAATDLLWGKVFNAVTFPAMAGGLLFQGWYAGAPAAFIGGMGILVALLFFFPFYLLRAFAAGDVKLLMVVGAWSHSARVLEIGAYAILIGASVALVVLILRLGLSRGWQSVRDHFTGRAPRESANRMPFAPAFLCAFFLMEVAERLKWNLF